MNQPVPHSHRNRRLTNWLIVTVLLVQLALPLRFYVGKTSPDERFAWRMFSTLQREQETHRTQLQFSAVDEVHGEQHLRAVDIQPHLSPPWINFLHRGYPPVLDKLMTWLPQATGEPRLLFVRRGRKQDGTPLEVIERRSPSEAPP